MLNMRELARRHIENQNAIEMVAATPVGVQLGARQYHLQAELLTKLRQTAVVLKDDIGHKLSIEQRLQPLMEKLDDFSGTLAKRVSDRLLPEIYTRMVGHLEERLMNYFKYYAPHVVEEQAQDIAQRIVEAIETGSDVRKVFKDRRIKLDDPDELVDYLLDENIRLSRKDEDDDEDSNRDAFPDEAL